MKATHTSGEWKFNKDSSEQWKIYSKPNTHTEADICKINIFVNGGLINKGEAESNAKLIAAAPLLYNAAYNALQAIYAMSKGKQGFYKYLINDLLNAIQKADGTII